MNSNSINPNKYGPYRMNSNHRTSHSSKKLSEAKLDRYINSQSNIGRADLRAFIDIIPKDQRMIEEYIQQLKEKLQQMRSSPKKKNTARLQKEEIFKRKVTNESKMRSKSKSVVNSSAAKQISKSLNLRAPRQMQQKIGLHNFKKMRDDYKRSKLNSGNYRLDTDKQSNRYSEQKNIKTQVKPISSQKQSCELRVRANTEEVIRNQKNPARIYRYSSQKKSQHFEPDDGKVKNNFIFDKFINVSHNINIYPRSLEKPQRLRKQIQQEADYPHRSQQKSPKKISPKRSIDKLNQKAEKLQDISTINARKQTINFLGQSCLQIKEQLQKPQNKEVEKLLDFIGWRTIQMKKALANGKQKKRKNGLDKLVKIFPKGFFA